MGFFTDQDERTALDPSIDSMIDEVQRCTGRAPSLEQMAAADIWGRTIEKATPAFTHVNLDKLPMSHSTADRNFGTPADAEDIGDAYDEINAVTGKTYSDAELQVGDAIGNACAEFAGGPRKPAQWEQNMSRPTPPHVALRRMQAAEEDAAFSAGVDWGAIVEQHSGVRAVKQVQQVRQAATAATRHRQAHAAQHIAFDTTDNSEFARNVRIGEALIRHGL